jgi:alcohol sulfotransferase
VFRSSGTRLAPGDQANPQSYKVRRAKVGGWRDYFNEAEAVAIDAVLAARPSPPFGYGAPAPAGRRA